MYYMKAWNFEAPIADLRGHRVDFEVIEYEMSPPLGCSCSRFFWSIGPKNWAILGPQPQHGIVDV